jgi:hypothetical protein
MTEEAQRKLKRKASNSSNSQQHLLLIFLPRRWGRAQQGVSHKWLLSVIQSITLKSSARA